MISSESFAATLYMNVENDKLTDHEVRELVRDTIDAVEFPRPMVLCKFCDFQYSRRENKCDSCSLTICPMCSSCQSNEATSEFVKGSRFRRWVAEGH
jgi:hypothetical protein